MDHKKKAAYLAANIWLQQWREKQPPANFATRAGYDAFMAALDVRWEEIYQETLALEESYAACVEKD